ncbi:MmgE/PrpD family protein (plasmid) [Arthrobacter sp. UC242_113]|uniref:MmgE/PrpD family protein n=1 Tax=Arthrobacter sp. UC242_113 TaxID=3374550 RepID=UPI003757A3CE
MNRDDLAEAVAAAIKVATSRERVEVSTRTRWVLADTISVALAAGRRPLASALVRDHVLTGSWRNPEKSPDFPATLLTATGGWAQPDRAAYINGSILCDLEMDEGVRPTGHPAAHVLPAVLAAGEALNASLGSILDSLLVGYEITAYLLETFTLAEGIHPHGHLGAIGAAVAVAHLRRVDALPAALVAATTQLITTWGPCTDGATARNTWTGHAAQTGLLAQRLADAGWEGSAQILGTAFDGRVAFKKGAPLPSVESPRILNGYFKFFSACALTHTSIEAALSLAPLNHDDIATITVRTTANNLKVAAKPADNALSRRFSIPFAVAAALSQSSADASKFDAPDAKTADLAQRVNVEEEPAFTGMWPAAAPAKVSVRLKNGNVLVGHCDNALGTAARPVSAEELREKSASLLGDGGRAWDILVSAAETDSISDVLASVFTEAASDATAVGANDAREPIPA